MNEVSNKFIGDDEEARAFLDLMREDEAERFATNVFCPTGPGGGIDPTCAKDEGGLGGGVDSGSSLSASCKECSAIAIRTLTGRQVPDIKRTALNTVIEIERSYGKADLSLTRSWRGKTIAEFDRALQAGEIKGKIGVVNVAPEGEETEGHIMPFLRKKVRNIIGYHDRPISFIATWPAGKSPKRVSNVFCPTGPGGGVDPHCSPDEKGGGSGARTDKHIKADIKELRKEMKEKGIKESSFMNRHPSLEAARANERLFALKTELEGATKTGTGIGSRKHIKEFLSKNDVTSESFAAFGPMTKTAVVEKYNSEHKTKLSLEEFHRLVSNQETDDEPIDNFDPNQPRDSSGKWSSGGGGGSSKASGGVSRTSKSITGEPKSPPPPGKAYYPDVTHDGNKDGVTDAARVGVPAHSVPPPPPIGRLPNLTPHERQAETEFIGAYESDPDGVAGKFLKMAEFAAKPGEPLTFGTDDAKNLYDPWIHPDMAQRSENRATLNIALHQTANAITKRAFIQHLDTLQTGDEVMVTVGGCGAGKGYALGKDKEGKPFVPEANAIKSRSKVVWDSAGDQNATENPWIQEEAEKRGLKVNYVYVHAEPYSQWANPERGVVKRAADPKDGRMVDAKVFADSYAIGAKNHEEFYQNNKSNSSANFVFIDNTGKPRLIDGIPHKALTLNAKDLAEFAADTAVSAPVPPHIKRGATIGNRIWR